LKASVGVLALEEAKMREEVTILLIRKIGERLFSELVLDDPGLLDFESRFRRHMVLKDLEKSDDMHL
jgi:hypothetical protein